MSIFDLQTTYDIAKDIALREKKIRKKNKITQERLAVLSGVSQASIKRFEQTGKIEFISLLNIAKAIGKLNDFNNIFTSKIFQTIKEVINEK